MSPLDLPGPQFLAFYLLFGVAGLVAAVLLRRLLMATGGGAIGLSGRWCPGWFPREEDAYAIARLRVGRSEVARAVLGYLQTAKLITCERKGVSRAAGAATAAGLMPIEREGLKAIADGVPAPAAERQVTTAVAGWLDGMERELETDGVIWPRSRQAPFRWLRNLTLLAIVGLGVAKLLVAMGRGRPNTGFLVVMTFIYMVAILLALAPPVATPGGQRYLEWLRDSHSGLLSQVAQGRATQPRQVMLAAAIYGMARVPSLAGLQAVLRRQSGGGGGGGTGSGCSGGSGCGGGGCGGGGCGGCGS